MIGPGISGGFEIGELITRPDGSTYNRYRSNPTKADTDGDGLDEVMEDYLRTDPNNPDTDHDNIRDGEDDQPLVPASPLGDYVIERFRQEVALRLGATFGETGLEGEAFCYLVGAWASHPYYLMGWITSGLAVYGDVRDFIYAVYQYDTLGAAITGIGLVPYLGDCERTAADIAKYLLKYPDKVLDVAKYLVDQHVIQILPSEGQLNVIDHFYLFATGRKVATELKAGYTLTDLQIQRMIERKVELDNVIDVIKVDNGVIPTVIGDVDGGWTHLEGRHITGAIDVGKDQTTLFPMQNQVTWYGEVYPSRSVLTVESLKQLIDDGVSSVLTDWPQKMEKIRYPVPDGETRYGIQEMIIIVNPNYGIANEYPLKGSQVYRWNAGTGTWKPTL